jgi:predicted nucleic acid-binding protein
LSGYLLDTSILSVLVPGRKPASEELVNWLTKQGEVDALSIPSIAIAEVEKGICKLRRAGGSERADRLSRWLDDLVAAFGDRILGVDATVARIAGAMEDAAIAKGKSPGLADVLIGATAKRYALTVLTANEKHFKSLEIAWLNPLVGLPGL